MLSGLKDVAPVDVAWDAPTLEGAASKGGNVATCSCREMGQNASVEGQSGCQAYVFGPSAAVWIETPKEWLHSFHSLCGELNLRGTESCRGELQGRVRSPFAVEWRHGSLGIVPVLKLRK
ncbi:unnamed protein product [Ostreobium quekettii]|uniref:Uncharacterized protein n=1 Tax=Ostreobium quekettii TaxID=121088 RepID=A0A8S1JD50_9CHLO|nr:unnamed protein product [Ostreobium quekettii]